jgi:hypothetical protein
MTIGKTRMVPFVISRDRNGLLDQFFNRPEKL